MIKMRRFMYLSLATSWYVRDSCIGKVSTDRFLGHSRPAVLPAGEVAVHDS